MPRARTGARNVRHSRTLGNKKAFDAPIAVPSRSPRTDVLGVQREKPRSWACLCLEKARQGGKICRESVEAWALGYACPGDGCIRPHGERRSRRAGKSPLEDAERVRRPAATPRHLGRTLREECRAVVGRQAGDQVLRARRADPAAGVLRRGVQGLDRVVLDDAGLPHRQVPRARLLHHRAVRPAASASSSAGSGSAAATSCATRSMPSTA